MSDIINAPAEPAINIDILNDTRDPQEDIEKYAIPDEIYFLKDKRKVPITELRNLVITRDKNKKGPKITLRGTVVSTVDGKEYKTSTYLGLKERPKKKRAPRKKRAKTDAAQQAAADDVPAAVVEAVGAAASASS